MDEKPEIIVEQEQSGAGGRYLIRLNDGEEAEMTYRAIRPGVIAIDHTGVPPQFRGQGLAEKLVLAGIRDAKANGTKIIPLCSYVAAQFRRHPEWAELRAEQAV